jgi:hypothetical protein
VGIRRESPLANRATLAVISAEVLECLGDIALVVISDQKFYSAENFPIVSALQLKLSGELHKTINNLTFLAHTGTPKKLGENAFENDVENLAVSVCYCQWPSNV